jgi:hypothetical protein
MVLIAMSHCGNATPQKSRSSRVLLLCANKDGLNNCCWQKTLFWGWLLSWYQRLRKSELYWLFVHRCHHHFCMLLWSYVPLYVYNFLIAWLFKLLYSSPDVTYVSMHFYVVCISVVLQPSGSQIWQVSKGLYHSVISRILEWPVLWKFSWGVNGDYDCQISWPWEGCMSHWAALKVARSVILPRV